MQHKRPKGQRDWSDEKKRELLGYHNSGLDQYEVAELMGEDDKRVRCKADLMGVILARRKKC